MSGAAASAASEATRDAFTVDDERSFDQDPRFGACVLSEIASRALSPAVNHPGTAIDILNHGTRVLALWSSTEDDDSEASQEVRYPRVHVPPLALDELFDDFFTPIARDGAGNVEVCIHLQKMLRMLAHVSDTRYREAAQRHSALALARAREALTFDDDRQRVQRAASRVESG